MIGHLREFAGCRGHLLQNKGFLYESPKMTARNPYFSEDVSLEGWSVFFVSDLMNQ
jgi:hypothetical protein